MIRNGIRTARPTAKLRAGRADWYRIENSADDSTDVYIYDEIGYFGVTAQDFTADLRNIKTSTITLHLDTPGGDVYDGINIYNAIKDHPATVTVKVDGIAASAGSYILQAGDHRVMNRNSEVMVHDAHTVAMGNAAELQKMLESLERVSNNIASIYADRCGGTVESWRDVMRAETWYSADEAVSAGLADEVVGGSTGKPRNDFDLSIYSYAGREHAPTPVISDPDPVSTVDWVAIADAMKGAFA